MADQTFNKFAKSRKYLDSRGFKIADCEFDVKIFKIKMTDQTFKNWQSGQKFLTYGFSKSLILNSETPNILSISRILSVDKYYVSR